jgi:hypothetical protein
MAFSSVLASMYVSRTLRSTPGSLLCDWSDLVISDWEYATRAPFLPGEFA